MIIREVRWPPLRQLSSPASHFRNWGWEVAGSQVEGRSRSRRSYICTSNYIINLDTENISIVAPPDVRRCPEQHEHRVERSEHELRGWYGTCELSMGLSDEDLASQSLNEIRTSQQPVLTRGPGRPPRNQDVYQGQALSAYHQGWDRGNLHRQTASLPG